MHHPSRCQYIAAGGSGLFSNRDYNLDKSTQERYSAIKHLASSLFLNHDPESRIMAMFTAYFDESGTHETSPAIVVAGYISTVDQWQRFETEWKDILNDAGIPFFRRSKHQNKQGPYKNWDDFRHKRILERIILTIKRRAQVPISASVITSVYHEASNEDQRLSQISPYTFCALQCLSLVGDWANQHNHREPIAYVFEAGAGYNKELDTLNYELSSTEARKKRYRFGSFVTADKRTVTPLQAADVLAYEHYKEMLNCIVPGKEVRPPLWSAIELLNGQVTEYCRYSTKENLLSPTLYVSPDEC